MPFPTTTPTDLDIEMNIGGTWTNLRAAGFVLDRGVTITRGRADETSHAEPSKLQMTLDNKDGRFSARNPSGPYYGLIGRNTPVRASIKRGAVFLEMLGNAGDKVTAPDAAPLDIVGDIDVRIDMTADSWGSKNLAGKWRRTGNQLSWILQIAVDGTLRLSWTTDGTLSTPSFIGSTLPIPMTPGRLALRATLKVNNGAGGTTGTFYTSDSISGVWTQLGAPVAGYTAGISSIFSGTAPLEIGELAEQSAIVPSDINATPATPLVGRVHAFELRNGIGGTVVANPNFTAQAAGTTSFADTATTPNTWTLAGGATITNRRWRFWGELSTLPTRWDTSGKDVYVPAEASGMMRRLGQGASPLRTPIYRSIVADPTTVQYWPCEEGKDATSIASAIPGGKPMTVVTGGAKPFHTSTSFDASGTLPTAAKTKWYGLVNYTASTDAQMRFLLGVPTAGSTNNLGVLASVRTTGSLARVDVLYSTVATGGITFRAFDDNGGVILDQSASSTNGFNGVPFRVSVELQQRGADVNVLLNSVPVGVVGGVGLLGTAFGYTYGKILSVAINPQGIFDDVTFGHISVHNAITDINNLYNELIGFAGETAGRRAQRLCQEEGVPFRGIGNLDDTAPMGLQQQATLLDLLQECADADMGVVYETREMLGVGFRTRKSLYSQPARVALDYAAGHLSDTLDPTDDDQQIRNDITVERINGSSAHVEQTTGPLSTAQPPNGVGRYDDHPTLSLATDDQAADQAAWRLRVGTVDEARYPQIGIDHTNAALVANSALTESLIDAQVGDRLTVSNPPAWLPPDQISQLIQGTTETFGNYQYRMTLNCSPESPWQVGVLDDLVLGRLDTDGAQLATAESATDTIWSVATTSGPLWTTNGADWPFDVRAGGEVVTVTAVGQVLNANPDFEAGVTGWAAFGGGTISPSTAQAKVGGQSCLLTTGAAATPRFESNAVVVTASAAYHASGWLYAPQALPLGIGLNVNWYDSTGVYISTSSNVIVPPVGVWVPFDATFTAPATAGRAGILLACSGTPGAGLLAYGDEIRLVPTSSNATSPQTFTVTRSVNGVVKAQTAGTDVRLAHPTVIAL